MTVLKFVRIFSGGNQKTNTITKLSSFFFCHGKNENFVSFMVCYLHATILGNAVFKSIKTRKKIYSDKCCFNRLAF